VTREIPVTISCSNPNPCPHQSRELLLAGAPATPSLARDASS